MNSIQKKLEKMSISDLKSVCQKLGISCPRSKGNIIKKLLKPVKIKYKMEELMTINQKMLKDLAEYRKLKKQKSATKIEAYTRGYLSRKKINEMKKRCHKQIQNVIKLRNSINRDMFLKNPITNLRKKTFKIRNKQLKDCLQNKQSTYSKP